MGGARFRTPKGGFMRRFYISLGAGVVLAIVAVLVIRAYVGAALHGSHEPDTAFTRIAVAARDLPSGTALTASEIRFVRWPKDSIPTGAFGDIDSIFKDAKTARERVSLVAMVAGEPLLRSKISGLGARPILSSLVADGMRAVSIKIDDVSGVSGFILPGDRVDVILTRHTGSNNNDLVTDIILQNIKVLGIDQLASTDSDKPVVGRTATVEVTPEQAGKLVLAQQAGTLSLALRNAAAVQTVEVARLSENDLQTGRRPPPAKKIIRRTADAVEVQYGAGISSFH
jgi:pilus assembly protein CpaB